jgi:hypothetical protein
MMDHGRLKMMCFENETSIVDKSMRQGEEATPRKTGATNQVECEDVAEAWGLCCEIRRSSAYLNARCYFQNGAEVDFVGRRGGV